MKFIIFCLRDPDRIFSPLGFELSWQAFYNSPPMSCLLCKLMIFAYFYEFMLVEMTKQSFYS